MNAARKGGGPPRKTAAASKSPSGKPTHSDKPARSNTPVRSNKPVRADKAARSEEPARADKSARTDVPARSGKPGRSRKPARSDGASRPDDAARPATSVRPDKRGAARSGAPSGPLRGRREQGRKAAEPRESAEPRRASGARNPQSEGGKPTDAPKPRYTRKPTDARKPSDALEPADAPKPTDAPKPRSADRARSAAAKAADARKAGAPHKPSAAHKPSTKDRVRPTAASSAPADPVVEAPRKVPAELTGYLAPPGLEAEVLREVGPCWYQHGRLILCKGPPRPSVWAQDVWLAPQHRVITSIGDAANALRAVQRNWVPLAEVQHRRLALIADKLPPIKTRTWPFPTELPDAAMGAYTLLSHDRLLFSATRSSPFPHGEVAFDEDHEGPPSRAYRKLWEVFTLLGQQPQPGERCIDMGASPGGWTWVLANLGAQVMAVDKAPLAPAIASLPNVHSRVGSAFALQPEHYTREPFDWFFSDVICYPARLFSMVQHWIAADAAKRFVCTLKFQGETDHDTIAAFAAIPGSRLLHLAHNRHELTWVKL